MSVTVLRSGRSSDARAAVDDATLSRDRLEHYGSSSVRGRFGQGSGRHLPKVRQPKMSGACSPRATQRWLLELTVMHRLRRAGARLDQQYTQSRSFGRKAACLPPDNTTRRELSMVAEETWGFRTCSVGEGA
jgi:hypothetical protein